MREFYDARHNVITYAYEGVDSTNDEAFKRGRETGAACLFITGARQFAGRGRRGRSWVSEPGNLYTSIYLRKPCAREQCAELSFVAALALYEAIAATTNLDMVNLALKWPNDLLLNDAKIAGLLLEARQYRDDIELVIGIGVNCAHYPAKTDYPATSFLNENIILHPGNLFLALKDSFMTNLALWNRGQNFARQRASWLNLVKGLGETLTVRLEEEEIEGIFQDIDERGRLILRLRRGQIRKISAGDVFFPKITR